VSDARILSSQPIVFPDGTMQYHFRDFLLKLETNTDGATESASWGSVTGTLSSQTDLQAALDAKPDISGTETITGDWTFTGALDLTNATVTGISTVRFALDGGDATSTVFTLKADGGDATNALPYNFYQALDGGTA